MFKDVCGVLLFYPSLPYFLRTFAVVSKLQHVWQTLRRCSLQTVQIGKVGKSAMEYAALIVIVQVWCAELSVLQFRCDIV